MIRPQFLIFSILLNLFVVTGYGQAVLNSDSNLETPNEYYLQVKQFGEFIDRFNYQSDWKGNRISDEFAAKVPRFNYLTYLLNHEDPRLLNGADSTYLDLCNQFFHSVTNPDSGQNISLFSGQVVAKAKTNIAYRGKIQNCTIYFQPEVLNDRSAKWVISKVQTDCFRSFSDSLKTYFIAPNSHETSFINVKRLGNLSNPIYFFPKSITSDTTLIFMTEVAAERLTINYVEKVTYLISFPEWQITVEEFNRANSNSGWLISNITRHPRAINTDKE